MGFRSLNICVGWVVISLRKNGYMGSNTQIYDIISAGLKYIVRMVYPFLLQIQRIDVIWGRYEQVMQGDTREYDVYATKCMRGIILKLTNVLQSTRN